MQLGAFYAGVAIENSMLGAAHACANPLTARYDTAHGQAIALMLPSVVRFNAEAVAGRYDELLKLSGRSSSGRDAGETLARRIEQLIAAGSMTLGLREAGVLESDLGALAGEAASQWTGRFNPRPFGAREALEVYRCAF
jgi:alcohol dehydrogenase